MAYPLLSRLMLSGLAITQTTVALIVDLHRSHATNPEWLPHARFHVVWQTFSQALLAIAEVALIWWSGPSAVARFYLAASLVASTLASFWVAFASKRLYGGALFDQNGILPLTLSMRGRVFHVEMNTAGVVMGSILLAISVAIY